MNTQPAHDEENRACDKNMLIGDHPCTCGATVLHNYAEGEIPNPVTPAPEWREEVQEFKKSLSEYHLTIQCPHPNTDTDEVFDSLLARLIQKTLDQHSARLVGRMPKRFTNTAELMRLYQHRKENIDQSWMNGYNACQKEAIDIVKGASQP